MGKRTVKIRPSPTGWPFFLLLRPDICPVTPDRCAGDTYCPPICCVRLWPILFVRLGVCVELITKGDPEPVNLTDPLVSGVFVSACKKAMQLPP